MGVTIRQDDEPETLHELRAACELVKRKLSTIPQASINVFLSRHGKGYKKDITRAFFEELCTPLFRNAVDIMAGVLRDAKVSTWNEHLKCSPSSQLVSTDVPSCEIISH